MVIPESIQKNNLLMHNLPIHSLRREAKSRLGACWREARFAICYLLFEFDVAGGKNCAKPRIIAIPSKKANRRFTRLL
jgi:hypothetical protein